MDNQDNNKSAWNEPFYQTRSIGKCLSIGISFLSNRFLQIMKLALPVICILALFTTIVVYVRCDASLEYSIGQTLLFKVFATVAMTVAVAFVAAFVYRCVDVNIEGLNVYSVGYKYLYNKRFFNNVIIALIVSAIFVIVAVCLYLLASLLIQWIGPNENASMVQGGFSITHIAVGAGAVLLFVAVTVPLYMAISVMMLERNGIFTDLKRGYVLSHSCSIRQRSAECREMRSIFRPISLLSLLGAFSSHRWSCRCSCSADTFLMHISMPRQNWKRTMRRRSWRRVDFFDCD